MPHENTLKTKKYILIVEDEKSYAYLLRDVLVENNYEVKIARNGDEAIKEILEKIPDLIILDLILPQKSGYEVLETFKNKDTLKNTKVFVLSNLSQGYEVEKAFELGIFDFMVKTDISLKDLVERVNKLFKQ